MRTFQATGASGQAGVTALPSGGPLPCPAGLSGRLHPVADAVQGTGTQLRDAGSRSPLRQPSSMSDSPKGRLERAVPRRRSGTSASGSLRRPRSTRDVSTPPPAGALSANAGARHPLHNGTTIDEQAMGRRLQPLVGQRPTAHASEDTPAASCRALPGACTASRARARAGTRRAARCQTW